jgi:hypothetical protein
MYFLIEGIFECQKASGFQLKVQFGHISIDCKVARAPATLQATILPKTKQK